MQNPRKLIVISDLHVPYHHRPSIALVLKVLEEVKFDIVIINGDFLDLHCLSRHPRRRPLPLKSLATELAAGNRLLDEIDKRAVGARRVFTVGNHDDRLDRYIANNPTLVGSLSLRERLRLAERNWEYVPYGKPIKIGKVWFCHDFGNAGEGAHAIALRKVGASAVIAHTHRTALLVRGDARGAGHVGAMFGWLGDPAHALEYKDIMSQRSEWSHGFGVGLLAADGTTFLQPCPIVNGKVAVFGRIFNV